MKPWTDERLMMRPRPWARMCGRTSFTMRMTPKTLMFEDALGLRDRDFLDGARRADAGVVDQDVDAPEPVDHLSGPRR